jgi:hypothetical protein
MASNNLLSRESGPAFKERRSFIGAMATLGAGLAGSVVLPATALAQPTPEAHKKTKSAASVCGHSRRNNRRENPWIQTERCTRFQRCTLWRFHRWRQALHATSQA